MEDQDLKKLWQNYNQKLDNTLDINLKNFEATQIGKSKALLNKLLIERVVVLVLALGIDILLGAMLGNNLKSPAIAISCGVLMLFAVATMAGNGYQIYLIRTFDYDQSIAANQQKLAQLQLFITSYVRLVVLAVPFYIAYMLVFLKLIFGFDMWLVGTAPFWMANFILSILLVPVALWVYNKLSYKNIQVGWVYTFWLATGRAQVVTAMKFMQEIEAFKEK